MFSKNFPVSQSLLHQFRSGITPVGEEVVDDEDHVSTGVDHVSTGVDHVSTGASTGMSLYSAMKQCVCIVLK